MEKLRHFLKFMKTDTVELSERGKNITCGNAKSVTYSPSMTVSAEKSKTATEL